MPPTKPHRSNQLRPPSRNSSATKLAPNLQFTQKDAPQRKNPQVQRVHQQQRINRVNSRDHIPHRQPPVPPPKGKSKSGFTIAADEDEDDDDDEWTSESGAATPSRSVSTSDDESPPESVAAAVSAIPRSITPPASSTPVQKQQIQKTLPRVDTARPSDYYPSSKRARPPSMHSVQSTHGGHTHNVPLRPHPLIRGQSFGAPLAPLTTTATTTPNIPPAQLSSSPGSGSVRRFPTSAGTGSPTTTISVSPPSPEPRSAAAAAAPHRRTSVSSARSVATLPSMLSSREHSATSNGWSKTLGFRDRDYLNKEDMVAPYANGHSNTSRRNRTLSTLSSSSSSAAISSLVHAGAATRPPSPTLGPELVCYFPPASSPSFPSGGPYSHSQYPNQHHSSSKLSAPSNSNMISQAQVHPLLPPPYLSSHLTVLANRTPIRESYDRVVRAKNQMGVGGGGR
ncbi:hypothetical protein VKT23_001045 [Stygiomarasmius scandens]|uniref:Uncharacterized protein n=1 Tax=Marasmiellus scandens TaxID=2682957 RepID=A0ABR1K949_9AGAR